MKIKRIFTCKNGHSYRSKHPVCTSFGASVPSGVGQLTFFGIPISMPWFKYPNQNDRCKICGAQIMSEEDYVDGKVVMGAVYAPKLK